MAEYNISIGTVIFRIYFPVPEQIWPLTEHREAPGEGNGKGNGDGKKSSEKVSTGDAGESHNKTASLTEEEYIELSKSANGLAGDKTDSAGETEGTGVKAPVEPSIAEPTKTTLTLAGKPVDPRKGKPRGASVKLPRKETIELLPEAIKKAAETSPRGARFIGGILEAWMYEKTRSRADVCNSSGLYHADISTFLDNKRRAGVETIEKLAKVFRVDAKTFLEGPQIEKKPAHAENSRSIPGDDGRYSLGSGR